MQIHLWQQQGWAEKRREGGDIIPILTSPSHGFLSYLSSA